MRHRKRFAGTVLSFCLLAFLLPSGAASPSKNKPKGKVVFVCACLNTESCPCMTEAKMEGPCACGTEGGPPMRQVPADSNWAKQNRDSLAQQ